MVEDGGGCLAGGVHMQRMPEWGGKQLKVSSARGIETQNNRQSVVLGNTE